MKHAPELHGNGITRSGLLSLVSLVLPCPWRRGGQEVRAVSRLDGVAAGDIYVDTVSGTKASRPQLDLVLRLLRARDTLKITR